jgi:hypothetical protein
MATTTLNDEARRARNMQMFNRDLEVFMDQLRGMLAHYQIADWEAYVFLRKPDSPDSYVLKYEAAAGDELAEKIVSLHRQPNADTRTVSRSRSKKQKIEDDLRKSDLTARLAGRDDVEYGHHETLPRGEHIARRTEN